MSVAGNILTYEEPGKVPSVMLALLVHVLLALFLFFGVRWQSRHVDAVEVELWSSLPAPVVEKVLPPPEPMPEAVAEVKPAPKPEVTPEPKVVEKVVEPPKPKVMDKVVEPPKPKVMDKVVEPPKPDIALEKKKEIKKEPPPKTESPKKTEPKRNLDITKDIFAEAKRETAALERERTLGEMKREAATALAKAKGKWVSAIVRKIRPNVVAQPDIRGNPEAIFEVTLMPTGDVLMIQLRKSSGYKNYDEALERAIRKSSPLPKPQAPELFERNLELKFRPQD